MTSAKIRIKVGTMELEYEGDPAFLTGGIEALLVTMGDLVGKAPPDLIQSSSYPLEAKAAVPPAQGGSSPFTTNTIAAHVDARTGPELIICAMARLEIAQGKSSSNRSEIHAEMKNATTYYNTNMGSNLSASLANLVKAKRINESAKDTYALSANERKSIGAKVAEIG